MPGVAGTLEPRWTRHLSILPLRRDTRTSASSCLWYEFVGVRSAEVQINEKPDKLATYQPDISRILSFKLCIVDRYRNNLSQLTKNDTQ